MTYAEQVALGRIVADLQETVKLLRVSVAGLGIPKDPLDTADNGVKIECNLVNMKCLRDELAGFQKPMDELAGIVRASAAP